MAKTKNSAKTCDKGCDKTCDNGMLELPQALAEILSTLFAEVLFPTLDGLTRDEIEQALAIALAFNPIVTEKDNIPDEVSRSFEAIDKVTTIKAVFKRKDGSVLTAENACDWGIPLGEVLEELQSTDYLSSERYAHKRNDFEYVRAMFGNERALAACLVGIMCFVEWELKDFLTDSNEASKDVNQMTATVHFMMLALILHSFIKTYGVSRERIVAIVKERSIKEDIDIEMIMWIETVIEMLRRTVAMARAKAKGD